MSTRHEKYHDVKEAIESDTKIAISQMLLKVSYIILEPRDDKFYLDIVKFF